MNDNKELIERLEEVIRIPMHVPKVRAACRDAITALQSTPPAPHAGTVGESEAYAKGYAAANHKMNERRKVDQALYDENTDLRAQLREMTDLALAGQEAFEKLRLTTPPPPSPDAKPGERTEADDLVHMVERCEALEVQKGNLEQAMAKYSAALYEARCKAESSEASAHMWNKAWAGSQGELTKATAVLREIAESTAYSEHEAELITTARRAVEALTRPAAPSATERKV